MKKGFFRVAFVTMCLYVSCYSTLYLTQVVDASRCKLGHIELEELVAPGLVALDISGNTALSLDHHQFTKCK